MVTKMKARRRQLKKLLNFNLKVIITKSYELKSLTGLNYVLMKQLRPIISYMTYNTKNKEKQRQKQKIHKILLDKCVLAKKSIKYSTKIINLFRYASSTLFMLSSMLFGD